MPERDVYSEQCSDLLENLDNLEEDEASDSKVGAENSQDVSGRRDSENGNRSHAVKLPPLELDKDFIETPKNSQKLTTPGEYLIDRVGVVRMSFFFNVDKCKQI